MTLSVLRPLAVIAVLLPAAACQSIFPDEEDPSLAALRSAAAASVASSQQVDKDGFPLLGAYPGTAAQQLTDAEVRAQQARLNAQASQRTSAATSSSYSSEIARLEGVRQKQAVDVDAALAAKPTPNAPAPPSPEEVLRQIEAGQ
ncbi:hypothetical protein [Aurantimonas marina]|uniref:hypothetical protein n=1 Tax=Aurantimonas marina TaxID=2780508 RepID=UPI0019D1E303|nr:hypothetical protein [Aurantimonas marina]